MTTKTAHNEHRDALASPSLRRQPLGSQDLWLEDVLKAEENEEEYTKYALDLGAETDGIGSPIPPESYSRANANRRQKVGGTIRRRTRGEEGDCGICFEHATSPIWTPCCEQVFCADHIATWLHGPASDGLCPGCRAPVLPQLGSPTRSGSTSSSSMFTTSEAEEEDATDYSFAALAHARQLQARRHAPHPLSSVLGVWGALGALARVLGCVIVVGVLATSGRWVA
ncbi:hypothetical protein C8R43DRAFT_1003390 [Mycena crocata]|nr:hypothetical protein C8R43DRAFT_1003390 [Mycena crocata]